MATSEKEAFITLKDHKPNFRSHPSCRLINPRKTEIGKISKYILDKINHTIREATRVNSWRSTKQVLDWFNSIKRTRNSRFIQFDIVEFYPSITTDLLNRALDFAAKYIDITDNDRHIITHSKQSLILYNSNHWGKTTPNLFDVTMGSSDEAETCELIGLFLLYEIQTKLNLKIGLYCDDGLGIINGNPRAIENTKKDICALFKKYNLRVTIEANLSVVDFLDVTLSLQTGKFKPYAKPNNTPAYVNKMSNHPQQIIKNLPESINKRLSSISSDETTFNDNKSIYQKALDNSGYNHKLEFKRNTDTTTLRNRPRNILWFNPPFNLEVTTNIGQSFLRLLDRSFPRSNSLHKVFNRNNTKVSYSCTRNISQIIKAHNSKVMNTHTTPVNTKECNCRNQANCPLDNRCLTTGLIYQATVHSSNGRTETYVGLTENSFKIRYNNHQSTFRHQDKQTSTELSKYIWDIKTSGHEYTITWRIIGRAKPCSVSSMKCNLCTLEKYYIIYHPNMCTLNSRSELISTCRHSRKFTMALWNG